MLSCCARENKFSKYRSLDRKGDSLYDFVAGELDRQP